MTRQGDQRSTVPIQLPDSLTRTLRHGCLMDKQHPRHCFLGSPRPTLPPASQPFTKAGPHPHPASHPAGTSLLTNHGVREPAHPQPRAGHPSWGGSLSNTNTKFTLESPKSPWRLRWGQVPWAATLALVTRTPEQARDSPLGKEGLAFQKCPSQNPELTQGPRPGQGEGLPQPSPAKCVPLASHGGSPNTPIHNRKSQYKKKDKPPQLDNLQKVDS